MDNDNLRITLTWPVSTIDGEPSLTSGSLTITQYPSGDFLLMVSAGDEHFPDGAEIQFPVSAEHAQLVKRALSGEHIGEIGE
ncbi:MULTISPECIES: hypothetical protein [Microbacterium]|uniref:hypothetical protein n=1 Tax=Microbacterium TaxID=33882 RepID=UPI0007F404F0|nr:MULTISPECIES: hypothetical protein [unclassified Microbacterium]OAN41101.1 hypothetical protein A4X16_12270 [Microbacterium sp. H83]